MGLLDRSGELISASKPFNALFPPTRSDSFLARYGRECPGIFDFVEKAMPPQSRRCTLIAEADRFECQFSCLEFGGSPGFLLHSFGQGLNGLQLRQMMDRLELGFWDFDLPNDAIRATKAWHRIRGTKPGAALDMSNDDWLKLIHPEDREELRTLVHRQKHGWVKHFNIQYRHWHSERGWVWVLCRASVLDTDADGLPTRIVGVDTEISDLKDKEAESLRLAGKLQLALDVAGIGAWEFDEAAAAVHWDDKMLDIYGITDGENLRGGDFWESHLHPDDRDALVDYAAECQRENRDFQRDYRIVRVDGQIRHIRSLARHVSLPKVGNKLIGVNIDVTEDVLQREELERARGQLEYDAGHDALTGLGNRRLLEEACNALYARLEPDESYCVVLIDLDHFKRINDELGHAAGDAALIRAADIIARVVATYGQAFRIGGDEFVALLEQCPDTGTMQRLCQEIIACISEPFEFEGQIADYGASIGYAKGTGVPEPRTDVFVKADEALYSAKRAGRFCYRAADDAIQAPQLQADFADRELAQAIDNGEIFCLYQPQFEPLSMNLSGLEAIARWNSPKRGIVPPAQFLGRAAEAGYISAIDRVVFDEVVQQQTIWHGDGLSIPIVSVNVSKRRLQYGRLGEQIERLKPYHKLSFELLETAMFDELEDDTRFVIDMVRAAGIRIELDDFGSGHSSIVALQSIKPDRVKIDRLLVETLPGNPRQAAVLNALIAISRLEGAQIVLEGVETVDHISAVSALDCDALQGFGLCGLIGADALTAALRHPDRLQPMRDGPVTIHIRQRTPVQ